MGLSPKHTEVLTKRGLDVERLAGLGWETERQGGIDWLKIPIIQHGIVVNHKYRTLGPDKKFRQDKGGVKCFYNYDCLLDETLANEPLIITEGELDAESIKETGHQRVMSVPDGAPATDTESETKFSYMMGDDGRLDPLLAKIRPIILLTDNDAAGENLNRSLRYYLGSPRCQWVQWPRTKKDQNVRYKDINDVLQDYDVKGVNATLKTAQYYPVDGMFRMSQIPDIELAPGLDTTFPGLADSYRVRRGDFCVMTGIPSHGKTTVATCIAFMMAKMYQWKIVLVLFETHIRPTLYEDLYIRYIGGPANKTAENAKEFEAWVEKHFIFIMPKDLEDMTLELLCERIEGACVQNHVDMVVIDPWNEVDHVRERGEHITDYTGRAIKRFKRMAVYFNFHLIVTAHPTKDINMHRGGDGKPRKPNLYDIEGSRHWFGKADVGVIVHRDFDKNTTEVEVAKVRYQREVGNPGSVILEYDRDLRTYRLPSWAGLVDADC